MVSWCCVPKCANRISGHRFPKNPEIRKKWLMAIRRDKFQPNKHTIVCKAHFVESDYMLPKETVRGVPKPYLKSDAVPSKFAWTFSPSKQGKLRRERATRRAGPHTTVQPQPRRKLFEGPDPASSSPIPSAEEIFNNEGIDISESVNALEVEVECPFKDGFTQCSLLNTAIDNDKKHAEVQTTLSGCEKYFDIEALKDKPNQVMFYTGFNNYSHFMLIFNSFGDEVNHLRYYPTMTPATLAKPLSPANEFFLTCVRLRRAKVFEELGYHFGISTSTANNIFITWINYLFCKFNELELMQPFSVLEKNVC